MSAFKERGRKILSPAGMAWAKKGVWSRAGLETGLLDVG
jgi:hypothetical protein